MIALEVLVHNNICISNIDEVFEVCAVIDNNFEMFPRQFVRSRSQ